MVVVRSVRRGDRVYHYLSSSYRWDGTVHTLDRYLGTRLPKDLEARKRALGSEVWGRTWFGRFERIQTGYRRYLREAPGSVRAQQGHDFVVEFTYDTNRIEGSTLTLEDTVELLDRGRVLRARPVADIREALAHAGLMESLLAAPQEVRPTTLLRWHRSLFAETKPDLAGRWRSVPVAIRGSRYAPPPPGEIPARMTELFRWLRSSAAKSHPVERAAEFHLRFEAIHPFADGNGRVGRIAMNMLLVRSGYPPVNIRYRGRGGYYHALELASTRDDPRPFVLWCFRRYAREQRRFLGGGAGYRERGSGERSAGSEARASDRSSSRTKLPR